MLRQAASRALGGRGLRCFRNAVELDGFNRSRSLMPLANHVPDVAGDAWVAPNATVVGSVAVDDRASVWFGAVLRGDLAHIRVGAFSSVGDRAVISTSRYANHARGHKLRLHVNHNNPNVASLSRSVPTGLSPDTLIGRHVTIGAGSLLRSVVVEDECVIGQRCVLMEGSVVETGAVLADGTVLPPGRRIPSKQLWAGSPARYVRDCTYDEAYAIVHLAEDVACTASQHAEQLLPEQDFNAFADAEKLKAALSAGMGGGAQPAATA